MIPIAKPLLGEEEKQAVLKVIDSGILAQGEQVKSFEQAFAQFTGVKHAIATSNGTTALHAALLAHDIGPGDEVITTPFSFIATANVIKMVGATPVFVDIKEDTYNLDPAQVKAAITSKTKAIMPVYLFGKITDIDALLSLAQEHNLLFIEDACQAHGAQWQGKKAGAFGTGCFSFYPTKNMTTGEGGIITTNDDTYAAKVRKLIDHGSLKRYHHDVVGYNFRMTNLAAAIGYEQLKKLPQFNAKRQENAQELNQQLRDTQGIVLPTIDATHAVHQYTIRVTASAACTRDELKEKLTQAGIGTGVYYPIPIHKQAAYQEYAHLSFPITEKCAQQVLSLPVHPALTQEELNSIAQAVKKHV